ncbi:MAG: serine/threonine protein kinase, partial [Candidatus Xenobia bacterium]
MDVQRFGPYRIVQVIGEGGMAQVYRAVHEETGAEHALKVVKELDDEEALARFRREILICASLQHPNICRMLDWGVENGAPYIAMELLEGQVLYQYLAKEAPLELEQARPIIEQVLLGLEAIHAARVVHRDLKPGNVFLTSDNTVKIMDFGLANMVGTANLTQSGVSIGTMDFISPEQALDTSKVDHRTDLFNVGLLLYHMLSAHHAFQAPSPSEVLMRLVRGQWHPITYYRADVPPPVV